MTPLIFPLIIGFIFDMLTEIKFGFYFLPALIMSVVFYFLPFVFAWLNIIIAFFTAFVIAFLWAFFLAGMNVPSHGFIIHMSLYLLLIGVVLYLINVFQEK